jgi:hypothetical protein
MKSFVKLAGQFFMVKAFAGLIIFFASLQVNATLLGDFEVLELNQGQVEYLRDRLGHLKLEELARPEISSAFARIEGNLGLGYVRDTVWLRFTVERLPQSPSEWWLEVMPTYLDSLLLFQVDSGDQVRQWKAGIHGHWVRRQDR